MKLTYKHTITACFLAYIVQAIVVNFVPLLFLTFQETYGISLGRVTFLITFNFGLQLLTDFASAWFLNRTGFRVPAVAAHVLSAVGLLSLAVLPECLPDPFVGLLISVVLYAVGGGLLEVVVSPVVEACPGDNKAGAMSLLHSFYCWGHVAVILISTVFFAVFGIENWRILAALWALLPIANAVFFAGVPLGNLLDEDEVGMTPRELFKNKIFWLLVILMVCAGASEQAVAQWASAFAERGLGVSKTIGDLAGPLFFASMMGLARLLYGRFSDRLDGRRALLASGVLSVVCYLVISLSPWPVLGLIGCGVCGFAVGILWPGTYSMAAVTLRRGAATMFAYMALAGDLGCSIGPTLAGRAAALAGDDLHVGILTAIIFPLLLIPTLLVLKRVKKEDMDAA